jgi:hypothetical protein
MQDLKFDFNEVSIVAPEWEECWESILRLPIKPLDNVFFLKRRYGRCGPAIPAPETKEPGGLNGKSGMANFLLPSSLRAIRTTSNGNGLMRSWRVRSPG